MKSKITFTLDEYNKIKEQLELLDKLVSKKKLKKVNLIAQGYSFCGIRATRYQVLSNYQTAKELIAEIKKLASESDRLARILDSKDEEISRLKSELDTYKSINKKKNPFRFI